MASLPWYHRTTIYQIYPRSFYDTNADGIGDIAGIIQKLDYLQQLGIETIWISPFFKSPQQDFGYDISDYYTIAPEYGTLADVEQLISETHQRNMRIVFDMVMNHTSVQHDWFKESSSSKTNPKADWYIWRDKPNNWNSMTGGTGWQYSKQRNQYYWASFLPFQPDLNYHNPEVKEAMLNVVRYWLCKGVDGFRLDIFNVIYKDKDFKNNPLSWKLMPTETDPSGFFQEAKYTINQPANYAFAKELRAVCDEFGERLLLGEVSGDNATIRRFLGGEVNDGLGLVFAFEMLRFKLNAEYFRSLISSLEKDFHSPFMPVYVFSNHDRKRSISRINNEVQKAKLLHLLQLTVRGVPCMYYGEEIGMPETKLPRKTALDPIAHKYNWMPDIAIDMIGETINRDESRTPMQWNSSANAGFSEVKPWLPVNPNYTSINVTEEEKDKNSLLSFIRQVLQIRKQSEALQSGSIILLGKETLPPNVLGYTRKSGNAEVVVFINFSNKPAQVNYEVGSKKLLLAINEQDTVNKTICLQPYGGVIIG